MTQTRQMKLGDLGKVLKKDLKTLKKRTGEVAKRTAQLGHMVCFGNAPVAFGALRESIDIEGFPVSVDQAGPQVAARIRADAPHAVGVEVGTRPHRPPIGALLEWVRLRGAQGVDAAASGGTPKGKPGSVYAAIHAQGNGSSVPVDAALVVARRIQAAIAKNGTRPTWFMQNSLPDIERLLDGVMQRRLAEDL